MQNQPSDSYQYHSNFNPRAPNIVEQFALLPEYPNYQHVENIVPEFNLASGAQFNAPLSPNHEKFQTFSDEQNLQRAHTTLNYSVRDPYENKGEFESKLIGSPNHCISEQMNSAAMFDKQYLLLGNDNGLWVIDFSTHWDLIMPTQLICGCSFKKLQILEEFNIMIAIAGKKDMIRIYKLDSLLHLIKFVTNSDSKTPINLSKAPKKFTTPKCEKCGCILDENRSTPNCQNCGFDPKINSKLSNSNSSSPLSPRPSGKLNRKLTNITSHLSIYVRNYLSNSSDTMTATMWRWATDYVNLAESVKDCITFDVNETKNSIFLTVVTTNNGIILFSMPAEMKGSQECKFEFLKSYYVPGTPHFVSVVTDLSSIKQIITITGIGKAAVIDCYTTEVTEISLKKNITPKNIEYPSWISFIQIPYSYSLDFLKNYPVVPENRPAIIPLSPPYNQSQLSPASSTFSEKETVGVSRRSSSHKILPDLREPDKTYPRSWMTSEFPSTVTSNVPLSPPISPVKTMFETLSPGQVFICTISNTSHLVNIRAEPYKRNRSIQWSSDPINITLLPTIDDILVIAFEKQSVEVASLKTGKIIKQVTSGSPIKFLGESSKMSTLVKGPLTYYGTDNNQSDEFIKKFLFWTCKIGDDVYIYRGYVA